MDKPASYDSLLERIRARVQKEASASDQGVAVPSETDPNNKGSVSAPSDEKLDGKKEKQTVSESKENKDNGEAGKTLEYSEAETHGSGEGKTMEGKDPTSLPTDDVFKKKAEDVVNTLRERLNIKSASDNCDNKDDGKKDDGKKDDGKKDDDNKDDDNKDDDNKDDGKKKANEENDLPESFTDEFHRKLASAMLASEEGRDHVRGILSDALGAEAVENLIKKASEMEKYYDEQRRVEQYVKQAMDQMDPKERDEFIKSAQFHRSEIGKYENDFEKAAYQQGAMDAAAMAESGGQIPAIPGEDDEPTIEEIVMILDQLVQSGEIDPALAEAILMELMGQGGGGAAPAPAQGGPAQGGAAPAPKAASDDNGVESIVDEIVSG